MQIAKYIMSAAVAVATTACSGHNGGEHILTVSIEPQRAILEYIAGPSFTVSTLLGNNVDPETFDPSTAQRVAVDDSEIYFATGVLPFENKLRLSISDDCDFVDTSEGVHLMYGTHGHIHSHGDEHGDYTADPHYWSSISGIRAIAKNMSEALCEQYPDSAAIFNKRLERFNLYLGRLNSELSAQLSQAQHRTFAVWHPSLSYFARDYDLEQLSLGKEGKELSAKEMALAIDRAHDDSVAVFFFQPGMDSRQAEVLSENIGSKLVPVNPLAYDWEEQLKLIADAIARP